MRWVIYVAAVTVTVALSAGLWQEPKADAEKLWLQAAAAATQGADPYLTPDEHAALLGHNGWAARPGKPADVVAPRTPGAVALTAPFLLVDLESVRWWMLVANAAALVACLALVGHVRGMWWLPATAPLFVWLMPYRGAVLGGNPAPVVMASLVAGWWLARNDRDALAGVAFGVAATMRLWPGLVAAALFVAGRRKVGWSAAATFATVNLAGVVWFDGWTVGGMVDGMATTNSRMIGGEWNGSVSALTGSPIVGTLAVVAGSALVLWWARSRPDLDAAYAVAVAAAVVVSPISWPMYHLALLPALVWPVGAVTVAAWAAATLAPGHVGLIVTLGAAAVMVAYATRATDSALRASADRFRLDPVFWNTRIS